MSSSELVKNLVFAVAGLFSSVPTIENEPNYRCDNNYWCDNTNNLFSWGDLFLGCGLSGNSRSCTDASISWGDLLLSLDCGLSGNSRSCTGDLLLGLDCGLSRNCWASFNLNNVEETTQALLSRLMSAFIYSPVESIICHSQNSWIVFQPLNLTQRFLNLIKGRQPPVENQGGLVHDLSRNEEVVLFALYSKELYGLQIPQAIEEASGGVRKMQIGSLYPTLHNLEKKGYIESRWGEEEREERGGARRRYYKLTSRGVAAVQSSQSFFNNLLEWQIN